MSFFWMHLSGYVSLGISLLISFLTIFKLFCSEFIEAFVIKLTTLLPIKSPVPSADFWIALFEAVLNASVADCLA